MCSDDGWLDIVFTVVGFVNESVLEGDVYFWVFRLYTAPFVCILIFTGLCSSWAGIRLFNKIC